MALDLDGLVKDLGVTGEEETTFRALFGKPERIAVLEKGYLRQSDYSKHQDALKTEQAKLATALDRLNAEQAEWATLTAKEQENATALRASLEATEDRVHKLTQRATRLAIDAGIDPKEALKDLETEPPPVKKNEPPPVDTSKFVPGDQFASMSEYLFNLPMALMDIAGEHQTLTGERLNTSELRAELQRRATVKGANMDPRAVWEEMNAIPAKRQAAADAQRKKEIEAAELVGFNRARSEAALPVAPSNGVRSPLLRGVDGKGRDSVLKRPAPEGTIHSAASALATGKYREGAKAQQ